MSSVGSVCTGRKTEDLIDEWAHDAAIAGEDDRVKGRAGLRSHASAWRGRGEHAGSAAPVTIAEIVAPDAALAALEGMEVGVAAFAAGLVASTFVSTAHWYYAGWVEPHAKGDNLRALAQNDAVNVALARGLDFHPRFGAHEAAMRPGVERGTERLLDALRGDDAPIKPVLQERADAGFTAAERAFQATAALRGSPARAEALTRWMKDNGFAERMRGDVAFGKGFEYYVWLETMGDREGVDVAVERAKIHDRAAPLAEFRCRG
jgi:hypothetical protein